MTVQQNFSHAQIFVAIRSAGEIAMKHFRHQKMWGGITFKEATVTL